MRFSKKLAQKIDQPKSVGFFTQEDARKRGMRLAVGKEGSFDLGNMIGLYLLVDESDGVIADAKFQVFGSPALIGAAEAACELLLRRNYSQAKRISAELIDKQVRDKPDVSAFPEETQFLLNLILSAIDQAAQTCMDIHVEEIYDAPPISSDALTENVEYPGWDNLSTEQQITVIEQVIADDIRPYIELDAGGVQILSFTGGRELIIAYQGSCTSCYSATGATLNAIQQILRSKIHPQIVVIPDLSTLTL